MNLNQLKIFYLASKLGSLSAAGEELNITQPAVTKAIQRLQDYYEIKFLNRFGKKMALTDAGEVLYGIAEKIFELEKQAEESIRDFQQQKKGHIRIHASESFGAYYLPNIINPFIKANPNIRVSASILPTEQVAENTANLENDLGFISFPIKNEKLLIRAIIEDRLEIIVPPGHVLTRFETIESRNLKDQAIIMHEKGSATERIFDNYVQKNSISVNILLELSSNKAIKLAVEEGLGIGVISRNIAILAAIPFSDPDMKHKYYMVYHKDKYISDILQHLIDTADQWAAAYKKSLT
jgi:DNA-binding transcriptional LysR family regulator